MTGGSGNAPTSSLDHPDAPAFDCSEVATQQFDEAAMRPYRVSPEVQQAVNDTLAQMGPAEKASQMTSVPVANKNYRDIQRSPDVDVPGVGVIRGYRYRDAGRGVNLDAGQDNRLDNQDNFATVFPTASLRAASWDLDLEKRVGAAIGDETAASKNNALMAPCMNVARHPSWGRVQETYGEDPYHIGRMATAMAVGIQEYVVGCAKHFVANNIERDRSKQNAIMDEQTLREVYGRHFEMVVQDGGIGCVMAAYNLVNGVKSTQNEHLLRDILKAPIEQGGMGFQGFVISDWWAMPGDQEIPDAATAQAVTNEAVLAGTDVEVPWQIHYSRVTLANADQSLVEEAARRVLTQKFRFGTALDSDGWGKKAPSSELDGDSIRANSSHEDLAEEVVIKSAVLLQNGLDDGSSVLPLRAADSIAVVGVDQYFAQVSSSTPKSCTVDPDHEPTNGEPIRVRECNFDFAQDPALGDRGSSRVNADPKRSVGPFAGIQEIAGSDRTVTSGNSAEDAADADAVVVVVGYTPGDEGEEYYIAHGGDRSSLDLPPGHNELVQSVLDLDKPTVIIIESGSIVNLPWLTHANKKQATIWAGYPGQRGGLALGKLIFGQENFSGKMPMAWATEGELQAFKDSELTTNMGYFFGYREFDRRKYVEGKDVELVFPFGHGLSYSSFEYSNLSVPCGKVSKEAVFNVTVDITNTSGSDGEEVAMLFVKPPSKPSGVKGERPWKELKSFARVLVHGGKTVTAELPLRMRDLRRWEGGEDGHWVVDSGEYTILVGKNAEDAENASTVGTITVDGD
jgi:beta-glucosidase